MSATAASTATEPQAAAVQLHTRAIRVMHWLNALAMLVMIGSGWRIYSWYPALPGSFDFPWSITLGGDTSRSEALHNEWGLASALGWHFAGIWLLGLNFIAYVVYGFATGHFRQAFLPLRPAAVLRDLIAALRFRLDHRLGEYNAVQKLLYVGVLLAILVTILSGLSIWKPVQLQALTSLFGGYETARVVHFFGMAAIVGFLAVHVALTLIVPQTLVAMILGRAGGAHGTSKASVP